MTRNFFFPSIKPHNTMSRHWTEDMPDHDERPKRHWTEYLNNDDESNDRDDDWEWERQDDFGDSWDGEEEEY